jgi:hypothetical protein
MFYAPHQVAFYADHPEFLAPNPSSAGARWTWIAGRRFRGVRWL